MVTTDELLTELIKTQKELVDELRWQTHMNLRELNVRTTTVTSIETQGKTEIYNQKKRAGEIVFGSVTGLSDKLSMRIFVDNFTPIEFPKISDLVSAGATDVNDVLWVKNVGGGIYSMFSNFKFTFKDNITIEAVNKGSSTITMLAAEVVSRLRGVT